MKTAPVKLGYEVRDKITGFRGIVVVIEEHLGRCDQAVIQPPMKDGKIPASEVIDIPRLEVMSTDRKFETEVLEPNYEMGQEVQDTISNLKGKLIARSSHINGCIAWAVQPAHVEKREKLFHGVWIPEAQLKVVGKQLKKPAVEKKGFGSVGGLRFETLLGGRP